MKKTTNDVPRSVVYSFNGRWEEPLISEKVEVFFRKRRPVVTPSRVFFYVGSPVKKMIGFAGIKKIEPVDLEAAKMIRKSGAITDDELTSYIGQDGIVSAFWIGTPAIFSEPFTLSELNERHGFYPPQSFSNVSKEFEDFLLGAMK
jgi:predicted transcriptional regulator